MNVEYISDTGSRHEWRCVHCEQKYVVTYHYLDEAWSVQRVREDGQREIIDRKEADELLKAFPHKEAMGLVQSDTRPSAESAKDVGPLPLQDRGSLGPSSRKKGETASDPDASAPSA